MFDSEIHYGYLQKSVDSTSLSLSLSQFFDSMPLGLGVCLVEAKHLDVFIGTLGTGSLGWKLDSVILSEKRQLKSMNIVHVIFLTSDVCVRSKCPLHRVFFSIRLFSRLFAILNACSHGRRHVNSLFLLFLRLDGTLGQLGWARILPLQGNLSV